MAQSLIIGIGNPDPEYHNTRHNVGWQFLDFLAKKSKAGSFEPQKKLASQLAKGHCTIKGKEGKILLAKPQSYVNVTGPVVAKLKSFFKVSNNAIIIVHDDLDIPFGNIKLSFDKDSAGHRGIESIMKSLKTKKFYRLRIGTSNPARVKAWDKPTKAKEAFVKDFVLSPFTPAERAKLKTVFEEGLRRLEQK
ncbi:MAG: aminoacyl-tRNA hydrolase [Patescibacteria group bacterium]